MMNRKIYKTILPLIMVTVNICLSVVVFFLMRHVQELLNSDVRINLTEIVTQNKDAITSRLMLNLNSVHATSSKLSDRIQGMEKVDYGVVRTFMEQLDKEELGYTLFMADTDGVVILYDGTRMDVSGRSYFRLGIAGIPNISDKLVSRFTGDDAYVISVPLYHKGEIIGTVQKIILQDEMRKICALSLFSAQGYMYVVNSEGYTILHSGHEGCAKFSDNYFRDLYASGNPESSRTIQADIIQKRGGFTENTINGQKMFTAYTAIDKVHDWYLITSVPNDVVSPNANSVITLFYFILFVIVLIFSSSITYFLWYKNKQSAQLEKIAFVDPVTNGDTYAKFVVDATAALQDKKHSQLYILKFDIDNFKYVNNFYGFEVGDRILNNIYRQVHSQLSLRERVARISSDHFVALLEDASEERLHTILNSLENNDTVLYFSAGVYAITDPTLSLGLMVDKATAAAQSVKNALKKHISYYSEDFEKTALRNEALKRDMHKALKEDHLVPFYQPKVNIDTLAPVGSEALVRWIQADGTFISPGEFIPMCEQSGLITLVDFIVYEKVVAFQKRRLTQGLPCLPISVNFSRLHLLDPQFFEKITAVIKKYDIPTELIEFELTESAFLGNTKQLEEFTEQVHLHGFVIGMDDFGSGYSSLNMLKDVSIDILKIDKAFLTETKENGRRNIIFASIVEMAKQLDIKIIVEGVEFMENVELMRACGCTVAQGYYFARPMNEANFEAFLSQHEDKLKN